MIKLLLIPICFMIDQVTKEIASVRFEQNKVVKKFNGMINCSIIYNEGAFLGFLKNHKKVLIGINILCIIALFVLMGMMTCIKGYHLIKIGIAVLCGGAAGNIYDRMKRKHVVDFFSFKLKPTIYFNIADMFVFLGCGLIALGVILSE